MIPFENTYSKLPDSFYEKIEPEKFKNPELIIFNEKLAEELGIRYEGMEPDELALVFSGQDILFDSEPLAQAYAGYQFGHPVPQLGDGRAHLLGEVAGKDIQLKGSGRTRFSRQGDGRSALGPVIREYIMSEAMHALHIPTTRALCAVKTNEYVYRQNGGEPGGIFTRVADSHIRVGTFQYFAFRQDIESIKTLLDYTIKRHFPKLSSLETYQDKSIEVLKKLIDSQSHLVARWSAMGFIHGVMNTDNFSLAGITIDYGPCAMMDDFNFHKVFSSIDYRGRYSYFNQVPIAQWNILRLADCLLPLIHDEQEKAVDFVEAQLNQDMPLFEKRRMVELAKKLGIKGYQESDESLVMSFLNYLEKESLDFTLAFRHLPDLYRGDQSQYQVTEELSEFEQQWKSRVENTDGLHEINPLYIPRNHLVQKAITHAYKGDFRFMFELLEVGRNPFQQQEGKEAFALPPKKNEVVHETFCGT